jgi:hypothetical protein
MNEIEKKKFEVEILLKAHEALALNKIDIKIHTMRFCDASLVRNDLFEPMTIPIGGTGDWGHGTEKGVCSLIWDKIVQLQSEINKLEFGEDEDND